MREEFDTLKRKAHKQIQRSCYIFLRKIKHLVPEERYHEMHDAMQDENLLYLFSAHTRETLIENCQKGIDSTPFWTMIDAINSYYDGTGSQWRFMTEEGRIRYLRWSIDYATETVAFLH